MQKRGTNQSAFDHQALAVALSDATQQSVDSDNLPITKVQIMLSPQEVVFTAFDKHWCFRSDKILEILEGNPAPSADLQISPDGKKAAFVRDYNLWVQDIATGQERVLTNDGEQFYEYAGCSRAWGIHPKFYGVQARWSPDSKRLLTIQVDNRQVKATPIIHYVPDDGSIRPILTESRIAIPGDEHVETNRIVSIDIETGKIQSANYRQVPSNRSAHGLFSDGLAWWGSDSQHAYFVDTERGEKTARVMQFDTHTGATSILFEETTDTYIRLSLSKMDDVTLLPLPESNELIWFSERSGWAHLYLYDLQTGELKNPITDGNWLVRQLLHFDSDLREIWFQAGGRAAGRDPYYLDICRANIDTGEIITVASSNDEYTVLNSRSSEFLGLYKLGLPDSIPNSHSGISPNGDYVVTTRSRVDQRPTSLLMDKDGRQVLQLEIAEITGLPDNWQWPEPVGLKAADNQTDIYGVIFRPTDFSPDLSYPLIDCSLCYSELTSVSKGSFASSLHGGIWYFKAAALAELGFIVVMIDGRGTPYREKSFSDASYGWNPLVNYSHDRIAGINQLAKKHPYIDLSRVGSMSFDALIGTVYDLLQHPDFYHVGVSHGFSDPQLVSTIHGEYFEGLNPHKETHERAEDIAANLQGKLLLMHGMIDAMSHPAGTFRLIEALQKANKDFDMLLLPNEGVDGGAGGHLDANYAFRRTWDYFVQHLQGVEPPKEFRLTASNDIVLSEIYAKQTEGVLETGK